MNRVYGLFQKDLRNRSSKHLMLIQKVKPAVLSLSGAVLKEMAAKGNKDAAAEIARREAKRAKREAKAGQSN